MTLHEISVLKQIYPHTVANNGGNKITLIIMPPHNLIAG